jgi:hypothetical protein
VSPHFLRYAEHMVQAYVYRDRADHRLAAISLYNLRYNEAIESFVEVDNNHSPYIYQQPQSWGAVYLPEPNSLTNRWPHERVSLVVRMPYVGAAVLTACDAIRVGKVSSFCHRPKNTCADDPLHRVLHPLPTRARRLPDLSEPSRSALVFVRRSSLSTYWMRPLLTLRTSPRPKLTGRTTSRSAPTTNPPRTRRARLSMPSSASRS